ncbi:MAG TPA: outer membrane protein assembly factor BamE, partial [Longimicrobiaceae bacterium]|nr:outer membrane protein assembly factor BamE [Longimicrobiaceae bacterium]
MKIRLMLAAGLVAVSAAPAAAQKRMIAPGMTPAQVRDIFGAPVRTREGANESWTYWFYSNGCPIRCGSDDVVFFQDGHVVAAVLRSRHRAISGPSAPAALERAG